MKRILALLIAGLSLFGCVEDKTAVREESQAQTAQKLEATLAGIPGIAPDTIIAYPRWLDKQTLAIDFLAYKVTTKSVFGTAINLDYDSKVLEYNSYKKGDFLEQGGTPAGNQPPVYLVSPANSGVSGNNSLIIGASLFRGTPGVTGSGRLLTLIFHARQSAPTKIAITKGKLKSLQADDISGIHWPNSIKIIGTGEIE